MNEKFLYTICCTSCGHRLSKSSDGTNSYIQCPKCKAHLIYEVNGDEAKIKIIKESEKRHPPSSVPA